VNVGAYGALTGDRLQTYWVEGAGAGEPIRGFVASDVFGHYVAFDRAGSLVLRDTWAATEVDLGAAGAVLDTDQRSFAGHRAAAFSPSGDRLLYVRRTSGAERVVVRELGSANEIEIEPGPGLFYRAGFDTSGTRVVLEVVSDDTNHNGRLEWPVPAAVQGEAACAGPIAHYNAWVAHGDTPRIRLAPVTGGVALDEPGYVTSFGAGIVRRRVGGGFELVDEYGEHALGAVDCRGRLLHAAPERNVLLIGCATADGQRDVMLVGKAYAETLRLRLAPFELDWVYPNKPRLLALYPGKDSVLVDFELRQVLPLLPGDRVVSTLGERVLLRRGGELLFGATPAHLQPIGSVEVFGRWRERFPVVLVPPWVVDMAQGKPLGRVERPALALSVLGAVLVASVEGDVDRLPQGPLTWVLPQ
jgi:hypothetical protein